MEIFFPFPCCFLFSGIGSLELVTSGGDSSSVTANFQKKIAAMGCWDNMVLVELFWPLSLYQVENIVVHIGGQVLQTLWGEID